MRNVKSKDATPPRDNGAIDGAGFERAQPFGQAAGLNLRDVPVRD
jgi:hypothetical protein